MLKKLWLINKICFIWAHKIKLVINNLLQNIFKYWVNIKTLLRVLFKHFIISIQIKNAELLKLMCFNIS